MKRRGFTLLELLAVTVCLVLLILIVLYAVVVAQERARIVQCAANLRAIGQACAGYANNYRGWYPLHGSKDQNKFTADVSPFTGGSGYWFGDATFQGTSNYQDEGGAKDSRYVYAGIAQLLLNTGAYRSKGKFSADGQYLSDWRTFYCPNQLESTFFSNFSRTYNVINPSDPYDAASNTDKVARTVSSNSIAAYFAILPSQRQASQLPEIGYCATNGNSPGYPSPTLYTISGSNNKMWRYQGKYVYDSAGGLFAGKDLSGNGNEKFAAGFITDQPETIIMADVALCSASGSTLKLAFTERGRSDYLSFSHDTGLNTLYNDGRVAYMPLKAQTIPASSVYYGNNKGATVFGPR